MINVYWWSRVKENNEEFENFGDLLVPYILDKTTTEKYQWMIPNKNRVLRIFSKKWHYIIIGSILRRATTHSIIWGAGIMFHDSVVPKAKFLAVRGPLTRNRLLELGYDVPEVYGDPAVLISLFNFPKTSKKYRVGIIPHFLDYQDVRDIYGNSSEIKIIDLLSNDPQQVIDQINDCEKILSSSLHGIIVSHALKIPALWFKISNKLLDDIKFYDYYKSVKIDFSIEIPFQKYSLEEFEEIFYKNNHLILPEKKKFDELVQNLIKSFPFRKSQYFKKSIELFFHN